MPQGRQIDLSVCLFWANFVPFFACHCLQLSIAYASDVYYCCFALILIDIYPCSLCVQRLGVMCELQQYTSLTRITVTLVLCFVSFNLLVILHSTFNFLKDWKLKNCFGGIYFMNKVSSNKWSFKNSCKFLREVYSLQNTISKNFEVNFLTLKAALLALPLLVRESRIRYHPFWTDKEIVVEF